VKIGQVDQVDVLPAINKKKTKKKEINASKIYSPVGKFANRTKNKL